MTAEAELAASVHPRAEVRDDYGLVEIRVPADGWRESAGRLHGELEYRYLDWLTAYEDVEGVVVCLYAWSLTRRTGVLLSALVTGAPPVVATLTDLWAGADWHERETHEMFGVVFDGHPNPAPLLLPEGFDGHPLRKDFALAARRRPWPGAADPDPRVARRPPRPPGGVYQTGPPE